MTEKSRQRNVVELVDSIREAIEDGWTINREYKQVTDGSTKDNLKLIIERITAEKYVYKFDADNEGDLIAQINEEAKKGYRASDNCGQGGVPPLPWTVSQGNFTTPWGDFEVQTKDGFEGGWVTERALDSLIKTAPELLEKVVELLEGWEGGRVDAEILTELQEIVAEAKEVRR